MSIRIIPYRGGYRPYWYAEYKENGKTRQIRLTEKIAGVPPKSLSIKDEGSVLYEKSKARAQAEFEAFENERKRKGTSERLMEELTEKDVKGFLDWLKAQGSAHRYAVNGPKYTLFAYPFNHTYKIPMAMSTATRQPAQPSAISHICRDSK